MKVSVVIPAYNSSRTLRELLESIEESREQDFEVIVVDDGSTDDGAEAAASLGARVVRLERNSGPAVARNAGVKAAQGEIILFLDSDVRLKPGLIAHVAGRMEAEPELLALNGYYSPRPVNPGFMQSFKARYIHYQFQGKEDTPVLETCCAAVRKNVLLELGGFDESYRGPDIEDYELGYRISERGPMKIDHAMVVDHNFPGFLANTRNFFRRGAMWTGLLLMRRRFDTAGTTASEGLLQILGAIAAVMLTASPLAPRLLLPAFLAAFCAYLYWGRGFFMYLYREEGAGFALAGVLVHWANAVIICAGVVSGLLGFGIKK